MIDKIRCENRYGSDIHPYLIALLQHVQETTADIPDNISKEEYYNVKNNIDSDLFPDWYKGLVGFCASYSAVWFSSYAGEVRIKDSRLRNYTEEAIRNLKKQAPNLEGIVFDTCDFRKLNSHITNWVIYCDIPYRGTTEYKDGDFPYEEFYEWAKKMSKHNYVFISEYNMPDDFECIWSKEINCDIDYRQRLKRVEKLWRVKNGK